jgi:protocatechuate 3,4-dioxygenase beta subunit
MANFGEPDRRQPKMANWANFSNMSILVGRRNVRLAHISLSISGPPVLKNLHTIIAARTRKMTFSTVV